MMKKLSLLLALVMLFSFCMAGCGGGEEEIGAASACQQENTAGPTAKRSGKIQPSGFAGAMDFFF